MIRGWSIARRLFLAHFVFIVALTAFVGTALFIDARDRGYAETESRMLSVATAIAENPLVLEASGAPDPSALLQPYALSVTQWRVMAALGRFAPLTASQVGQRIVMDKVAVSRAVASLMKRGLVERATDQDDRRRASLELSAQGRAVHARIVPLAMEYEDRLYQALTPAERQVFNSLSDRLFAHAKGLRAIRP